MNLLQAYKECENGNFVSHKSFDDSQSMHMYMGSFYYEDGANLTDSNFDLSKENWAKDGWFIKSNNAKVDQEKLENMHQLYKNSMLPDNLSYENCLMR
jgi:hypothetical protein